MFKNYLKMALRNIKRYKGYSLINIAGLTVGMACFILIFLWVYDELNYDTFHTHSNRLFRIILKKADDPSDRGISSTPYILPKILKEEYPEIVEVTRVRTRGYPSAVRQGDITFYEPWFFFTDPSFFSMFSYELSAGNPKAALANRNSVVITRKAAQKYFGDQDPMGKILRWNNTQDLKVTGIIEKVPYNSHLQFDFMASLQLYDSERISSWWREADAYVQLQEGVSYEEVNRKIAGTMQRYHPEDDFTISLQPIREAHLNIMQGGRSDKRFVLIFAVIAVLILAIACVNFMNITTARSSIRAQEVGMRKVVGARRSDIIKQFLGESVLLCLISFSLAVVLVDFLLPVFNRLQGKEMSLLGSGNLLLYLSLIGAAVGTGFVAGSYPAFFLSAFQPAKVLKMDISKGRKGSVLRTVLVVSQFSVSVLLIIMTIVAYKQMRFIRNTGLGFSREQIVHIMMNDELRSAHKTFKDRLLQDPRIRNVTFASAVPHLLFNVHNFEWEGMETDKEVELDFLYVDHDYAETFDLEIVKGRDFSEDYPTDASEAYIVNESAVRFMEMSNPIGKRVVLAGREGRIIGVVKDFNHKPLVFDITPLVMGIRPSWYYDLLIKISPEDIPGSLAYIEKVFKDASPGFPFRYQFLDEWFEMIYMPLRIMNTIFNSFAFLAVFISCLGLFGLASLLSEQKRKEIGIRKVLGASVPGIMFLVSKKFLKIILIANLIAVPASYFATRMFLNLFVVRTKLDAGVVVATVALTFVVALVTISYQVIKTALANPVDSLRYE
ncbi:MAG: FtsX-like permease family protein [Candidatus Aminicenantes bacterium]|nr:FtsX-like permease family protein [Candidatus Aminicenantes bacterium]